MKKLGTADLPLHFGRCPRWLFERMVKLSGGIAEAIILEFGRDEFLKRISDPFFFQSLGCAVGFDYHSSGLTTTLTGALKEALAAGEYGVIACGGKGNASRKAQEEIDRAGEIFSFTSQRIAQLRYASRISAKVDSTAIQSGYQLYHHVFFLEESGKWAVVQQGLNVDRRYARRYHWLSDDVHSYVVEPHTAIVSDRVEEAVLNLTSSGSLETQKVIVDISREKPVKVQNMVQELHDKTNVTLMDWIAPPLKKPLSKHLVMPRSINWEVARQLYETQPRDFEEVLMTRGVGPNTIRALALISNLVYGSEIDWRDPVKFSFCVGGKDGVPFPVDRRAYDDSISFLKGALENAKIGKEDRMMALRRLGKMRLQ